MSIIYHDEHICGPDLCTDLVEENEETSKLQLDIPCALRGVVCHQGRDVGFSMSRHCPAF